MKAFPIYIVRALEIVCVLQHRLLPDAVDDVVQRGWILIFGYHCPFASWSFELDDKYKLGVWK